LDIYALDHGGRFPTDERGLWPFGERQPGDSEWRGPYLKDPALLIDRWGNVVRYELKLRGDGRARMRIWSLGKDRLPDTGDEIAFDQFLDAARELMPATIGPAGFAGTAD